MEQGRARFALALARMHWREARIENAWSAISIFSNASRSVHQDRRTWHRIMATQYEEAAYELHFCDDAEDYRCYIGMAKPTPDQLRQSCALAVATFRQLLDKEIMDRGTM